MSDFTPKAVVMLALISVAIALAALLVLAVVARMTERRRDADLAAQDILGESVASFLFFREGLADASPAGRDLLAGADPDLPDWKRLQQALQLRFPAFPGDFPEPGEQVIRATDPGDSGEVAIETSASMARIRIAEATVLNAADRHHARTSALELDALRSAMGLAPYPVWRSDVAGQVVWANTAYRRLEAQHAVTGDTRPILDTRLKRPEGTDPPLSARVQLEDGADDAADPGWYDVTVVRSGAEWLHYATDISPVIKAEIAQRNFVQTLAKTFALLSIGLAIFDRNRQLALFNPALIDLTALSPEFLSRRPSLLAFFDNLRDRQVMPEPKNYATWREEINDLAARAASGTYQETWSLPMGVTYRVTGRPHPDGAVAFLFEDISAEISMSRRFHQHIELSQSVIDSLDEGIAIFSRQGRLTSCNRAYRELFAVEEADAALTEVTAGDASRSWQAAFRPTPIWGEAREFVAAFGPRCEWFAEASLTDGTMFDVRFTPLASGASLVGFRQRQTQDARLSEAAE